MTRNRAPWRRFLRRYRIPPRAKLYTLADLQMATNNFSEENLLRKGSLGSVLKAEFSDGQVFAENSVDMVLLSLTLHEEYFLDVLRCVSSLNHPKCNCNLKAANALIDDKLLPRLCLCDCELSLFWSLTSNDVKLKASEMPNSYSGYVSPELGQPGLESTKADVYAFAVLLLELLTGIRPFDSSRPLEEESLLKWESSRLHDGSSPEDMVDPGLKRSISTKAFSHYSDVISRSVQPEKEFRPQMSSIPAMSYNSV